MSRRAFFFGLLVAALLVFSLYRAKYGAKDTAAELMAVAAQKLNMFLCVQDLTCPGASLIHSASIAAHIPGVAAIESNSRQYCPKANLAWEDRFPGIFIVRDGSMDTRCLDGPGLGAT